MYDTETLYAALGNLIVRPLINQKQGTDNYDILNYVLSYQSEGKWCLGKGNFGKEYYRNKSEYKVYYGRNDNSFELKVKNQAQTNYNFEYGK